MVTQFLVCVAVSLLSYKTVDCRASSRVDTSSIRVNSNNDDIKVYEAEPEFIDQGIHQSFVKTVNPWKSTADQSGVVSSEFGEIQAHGYEPMPPPRKIPASLMIALKDVKNADDFFTRFIQPGLNLSDDSLDERTTTPKPTVRPKEFTCPKQNGYFPDPNDCAGFYQCANGTPFRKRCRKGTLYDSKRKICNHASAVKCKTKDLTEDLHLDLDAHDYESPVELKEEFISRGRVYTTYKSSEAQPRSGQDEFYPIAEKANCQPRLMPVMLPQPEDSSLMYWPPCTELHQCGGCCIDHTGQNLVACKPVHQESVRRQVYKVRYPTYGASYFIPEGLEVLTLQNHTRCDCLCRKSPEDCTSYQIYKDCQCICPNIEDANYCTSRQRWDPTHCKCKCPFEEICPTGQYYSKTACSCVARPITQGVNARVAKTDYLPPPLPPVLRRKRSAIKWPDFKYCHNCKT